MIPRSDAARAGQPPVNEPDPILCLVESGFLGGVREEVLRAISPAPAFVTVPAGETLIHQNQPADAFYLLVQGRLRAFVADPAQGQRLVGEIMPGESIGEMSMLTGDPTSATVRAMHDSELVRFTRASFLQLIERAPEAVLNITRTVIHRLRRGIGPQNREFTHPRIVVLPLGAPADASDFAHHLVRHLRTHGTVATVTQDSLPASLRAGLATRDGDGQTMRRHELGAHLGAIEAANRITVYIADPTPTAWTQACLRQADMVLMVADISGAPELREIEATVLARLDPALAPRLDLVLLHGADWRLNNGAQQWLAPRAVQEHHHLRRWSDEDFARLARIIVGRAVCLVLGGGGARGFAQIGVVRAMREAGIPIDRVGGTSIGSLIGAQVAMDMPSDEMHVRNVNLWVGGKPMRDLTFPAMSIVHGRRLHNLVKNELMGFQIEDLPIRFFCVSGNLSTTDLAMHDQGRLWPAVRASGSFPGAGPPMFLDGEVLVDGGVLNNLPGDIMRERYGGTLIVVDVSPLTSELRVPQDMEYAPSGWRILWSRIKPWGKPLPVPTILDVLYRTATLSSSIMSKRTHALADMVLTPPVGEYAVTDFEKIDEVVEIGYRYARERLAELTDGPVKAMMGTQMYARGS